jgi:uncharacterized protein (TIGR02266 family)
MYPQTAPTTLPQQAISTLDENRTVVESRMKDFKEQNGRLDAEERRVQEEAARLEARIRTLAEEEIRLRQRKKQLREEARVIGERRKSIQDRRKVVVDQMGSARAEVQAIEARRAEVEQQQAYEEAQKQASICKPAWKGRERRECSRVAVEVEVSMHTEHNFYAGLTRDLSEGGLFIATVEHLPVGTELDLSVSLSGQEPICACGRIRWVREYNQFNQDFHPGVGVQFVDLDAGDRQAIESFLAARDPIFYDSELM